MQQHKDTRTMQVHPQTMTGRMERLGLLATTCLATMSMTPAKLKEADNDTGEPRTTATTLQATTTNVDFEGTQLGHLPNGGIGTGRTTRSNLKQAGRGRAFILPGARTTTHQFQHHQAAQYNGMRMRKDTGGGIWGNDAPSSLENNSARLAA